jgi:alanyl-tRNA synthetase
MTSSAELRTLFLDYFRRHGHEIVASSPLVPINDSTLLFTNAGMVQFKDVFTGRDPRPYRRAATAQRCVRAGGKHNDLENVGYTARHHTFFEMLGNFSFGDYFKADAIRFGWEFLTGVLKLPADKLWVTVYTTDDEAYQVWADEIKVPKERIARIGDKPGGKRYESDNFWAMGDTGPCGPCSEIFYDHGPEIAGGPPGTPDQDGDRYIEIWNLVFMQFDRSADGVLTPLPKPSVDTGMGLERLAAVMQGVHSNYEIDLFQNLIKAAAVATGATDLHSSSLRVIADHIRATAFLITDGVLPSNEGRGYVLRRIMRRAIRHGYKLGAEGSFFHTLVAPLAVEMGDAYPELAAGAIQTARVIQQEEERFAETLAHGMKLLEDGIANLSGDDHSRRNRVQALRHLRLPGRSHRRHRPRTRICRWITPVLSGKWRRNGNGRGRPASFCVANHEARRYKRWLLPSFTGYDRLEEEATVVALFRDGQAVETLNAGDEGVVVLDHTPFYAESGGQVGDSGWLRGDGLEFAVRDTQKQGEGVFTHLGILNQGQLQCGQTVLAQVNGAASAKPPRCIIPPRIYFMPRCAGFWERMLGRKARWSIRSGCASTSPISSRSVPNNSKPLNGWSMPRFAATSRWKRRSWPRKRQWLPERWRCSARNTAIRCGCCGWAIFPPSCAAAPTSSGSAILACSRSSLKAALPPGCDGLKPSPATGRWTPSPPCRIAPGSGAPGQGRP